MKQTPRKRAPDLEYGFLCNWWVSYVHIVFRQYGTCGMHQASPSRHPLPHAWGLPHCSNRPMTVLLDPAIRRTKWAGITAYTLAALLGEICPHIICLQW